MSNIIVIALYKFVKLADFEAMKGPLLTCCKKHKVKGTLLLAEEGLNGTIAGEREGIDAVLAWLRSDSRLLDIEYKASEAEENPFYRMKVKLKKEIVTLGVDGIDPTCIVGTYVKPQDWNDLISDPEVVLVDTRNDYEVAIGTFAGAINPQTTNFREFPQYVQDNLDNNAHKKVAMFCTGGIRCEKASAYMLEQGFAEVYHLQGGILKYLEEVPEGESLWRGECFVFDNRVAVDHQLEQGSYDLCHACRHPISGQDKRSDQYREGVSCPHCFAEKSDEDRERYAQRQKQIEIAGKRDQKHIGVAKSEILAAKAEKAAQHQEAVARSRALPTK